jgi:hypothetical protein
LSIDTILAHRFSRYWEFVEGCLRNKTGYLFRPKDFQDLRYSYILEGHTFYTCGIVFVTMLRLFREYRFENFSYSISHFTVKDTPNPAEKCFLAEQICLAHISKYALPIVALALTKMHTVTFQSPIPWGGCLDEDKTLRLFLPNVYNFRFIDAIILRLDTESNQAHLYPIRMTLLGSHMDSERQFYEYLWPSWSKDLAKYGLKVDSTFIWIDKDRPSIPWQG